MSVIQGVFAREVLDSRGIPTIECFVWLDTGHVVSSTAAAGTSVGKHEALELRDNDPNRMAGKGVLTAVNNINQTIAPQLIGKDPTNQVEIDQLIISLDGTESKSNLGANALIAVSQAVLKAGAAVIGVPLYRYVQRLAQNQNELFIPNCIYTMINGGAHGADNLDIQEFQIVPASYIDYSTSLSMAVTIYHKLEDVLISKGATHSTGMVGGFTPNLYNNTDAFEILVETIKASPFSFAQDVFFGADMSADSFHSNGKYILKDKQQPYTPEELLEYYRSMRTIYHSFCIEDPFHSDDWAAWKKITADLGQTTLIVGDSLLATNLERMNKAIEEKACNAALIKLNQIGTVTETIQVVQRAKEAGWQIVFSHRSGESNDDLIADFAVGIGADYTKFGSPRGGERVSKYNRLSYIQVELAAAKQASGQAAQTVQAPVEPANSTQQQNQQVDQPAA
jgi:enolase